MGEKDRWREEKSRDRERDFLTNFHRTIWETFHFLFCHTKLESNRKKHYRMLFKHLHVFGLVFLIVPFLCDL